MLNGDAVAFKGTKITEAAVAEDTARLLGDEYRKARGGAREHPCPSVVEIDRRLVPDRRRGPDGVVVDGEDRGEIGFGCRTDHGALPQHF
jgi:hypothetical protein